MKQLSARIVMDCDGLRCHNLRRVAVIDNGISQVRRLNYLVGIQRRIEQGKGLDATVCTEWSVDEARCTFD